MVKKNFTRKDLSNKIHQNIGFSKNLSLKIIDNFFEIIISEIIKDNKFMMDMYTILITGSRKMTPKMIESVRKNMNSPQYDVVTMIERQEKIKPILEKINIVLTLVKEVDEGKDPYYISNYSALSFVTSIMNQLKTKGKLSEKQMAGLNKVYKRYIKMKDNK